MTPTTKFAALPEFSPAPDLWSRIERRHARRRRTRWLAGAVGIASTVLLALAIIRTPVPVSASDPLAQRRHETLQLEQDWQVLAGDREDGYAQLRPLDVALQQAYDRQADGSELIQLWNQRNQLLRELIRNRRDGAEFNALSGDRISI